jgi:hypothetical protein
MCHKHEAQERINIYGDSIQLGFATYGASLRRGTEILFEGKKEPEDDLKTHTGRRYDYGRSV